MSSVISVGDIGARLMYGNGKEKGRLGKLRDSPS
jgi:hypothetical protein